MTTEREYRRALFMCAASCQGGHSLSGETAAEILGVPFPVRMPDLKAAAEREDFEPNQLWPWWKELRASDLSSIRALGGYARAAKLSPERRREIASKAATARWSK